DRIGEFGRHQLVLDPGRPGRDMVQTVVTHRRDSFSCEKPGCFPPQQAAALRPQLSHAVIVDVEATPARTYDEVAATKTMIEPTEPRFDIKPKRLLPTRLTVPVAFWAAFCSDRNLSINCRRGPDRLPGQCYDVGLPQLRGCQACFRRCNPRGAQGSAPWPTIYSRRATLPKRRSR